MIANQSAMSSPGWATSTMVVDFIIVVTNPYFSNERECAIVTPQHYLEAAGESDGLVVAKFSFKVFKTNSFVRCKFLVWINKNDKKIRVNWLYLIRFAENEEMVLQYNKSSLWHI
jgi:hypothetical protein